MIEWLRRMISRRRRPADSEVADILLRSTAQKAEVEATVNRAKKVTNAIMIDDYRRHDGALRSHR